MKSQRFCDLRFPINGEYLTRACNPITITAQPFGMTATTHISKLLKQKKKNEKKSCLRDKNLIYSIKSSEMLETLK